MVAIKGGCPSKTILIIVSIVLLVLSSKSYAQRADNLAFIIESNPVQNEQEKDKVRFTLGETSEVKLFLIGSIRLYQLLISPQDMPVCDFIPTCSLFGMQVIRRYGVIRGILLTSDRLQRCNGYARTSGHYPLDEKTGKAIDPVENYSPESKKK